MNFPRLFHCCAAAALLAVGACTPNNTGSTSSSSGASCPEGTATCVCRSGNTCDTGLMCSAGRCIPGGTQDGGTPDSGASLDGGGGGIDGGGVTVPVTLVVSNPAARACEVVVQDGAQVITGLSFSNTVEGRFLRRGERLAVAFSARSNMVLPADGATIQLQMASTSLNGITLTNNRCFDAQGRALPGATVALVDQR